MSVDGYGIWVMVRKRLAEIKYHKAELRAGIDLTESKLISI